MKLHKRGSKNNMQDIIDHTNSLAEIPFKFGFQELVERMSIGSIHVDLRENVKLNPVTPCKLFDVSSTSWLLV